MKIIKVKNCWECPHVERGSFDYCNEAGEYLEDTDNYEIPEWCALEDAPRKRIDPNRRDTL